MTQLAAWTANARKDSGDYWKGVMKDEPMPAALEALILPIPNTSSSLSSLVKKPDCRHEDPTASHAERKTFGYDIEPRPSVTAYLDGELGTGKTLIEGKLFSIEKPEQTPSAMEVAILSKSFEPRNSVSSYGD
uniref:Uncharacterized protein n=1 Tax=Kalanchoe fedtschenkoi TaxID=63787 RepID=A0A7N0RJU8_KALFE